VIQLKTKEQLEKMRHAGKIAGSALALAGEKIAVGTSTAEIDSAVREFIEKHGAKPSFLGYGGFPASCCISINDEVIHGIPSSSRIISDGDVVKVDVGAYFGGYHGDCANTFIAGNPTDAGLRIQQAVRDSFYAGIAQFFEGLRLGDIGSAIEKATTAQGFSVVRQYIGHGIGKKLHEAPEVPNFGTAGRGARLTVGMTLAIEPMITAGSSDVKVLADDWTVVTVDGSLSAHYEHTVALTENGVEILTKI